MDNLCVGHVDFMLFVLISFALDNQREPSLQWNNYGLKFIYISDFTGAGSH